jgi:hypothetical protein
MLRGQRNESPKVVNFGFLDRSRYFLEIAPQLSSRGWVDTVPDPLLLRKTGSAGNRTRELLPGAQTTRPQSGPESISKSVIFHLGQVALKLMTFISGMTFEIKTNRTKTVLRCANPRAHTCYPYIHYGILSVQSMGISFLLRKQWRNILFRIWMTKDMFWIGNWIYLTLRDRNYK